MSVVDFFDGLGSPHVFGLEEVGGWVGGWLNELLSISISLWDRKVEENEAVRRSYCEGGGSGGWVGG